MPCCVQVIEANVCQRLVELLMHPSPAVLVPALRTAGNIVTGNDTQTQVGTHMCMPYARLCVHYMYVCLRVRTFCKWVRVIGVISSDC